MKRLAIILRFSQQTGPDVVGAVSTCYLPVVEALREHITVKVHLAPSGTLLSALQWYAPQLLDAIRTGVRTEQFEIVGTTYGSCDLSTAGPAYTRLQVETHATLVDELLGLRPAGFDGSAWCTSTGSVAALAGPHRYVVTKSPPLEPLPDDSAPRVHVADPALEAAFQLFIHTGDRREFETRLLDDSASTVVLAVETETIGLDAFLHGYAPSAAHCRFVELLTWLERLPELETFHLKNGDAPRPDPGGESAGKPASAAPACSDSGPFAAFEAIAASFETSVSALPEVLPTGGQILIERARRSLAACGHGLDPADKGPHEGAVRALALSSLSIMEAAVRASLFVLGQSDPPPVEHDVDGDGVPEIILQSGRDLLIVSPIGGRVLYWIDLVKGDWLGGVALSPALEGPLASASHPYVGPVPPLRAWAPSDATRPTEAEASTLWFAASLRGRIAVPSGAVALDQLVATGPRPVCGALRRIGLFADEIDGALVTDLWPATSDGASVLFKTPYGTKSISVRQGLLVAEYSTGFCADRPLTVHLELLPERPTRPAVSGPPLRIEATDKPLGVAIESNGEPVHLGWQEASQSWVAGLSYAHRTGGPDTGLRVELTRHP